MTKIIGLTGGIGSGKSFVAKAFKDLGVSVYYSDDAAREIMEREDVVFEVNKLFENNVLLENGKLDRSKIKRIVFKDKKKLEVLNKIIHPLVHKDFQEWLNKHKNEKFIIKESALLFETKANLQCWKTILVVASLDLRIKAIKERDGLSEQEIQDIINKQLPDLEKEKLSDFIINNNFTIDILSKVKKLYNILINI